MKNIFCILILLGAYSSNAQKTYVPDNTIEQYAIDLSLDDVLDDSILTENCSYINEIITLGCITDFTGIEAFVGLHTLECCINYPGDLDLGMIPNLKVLNCSPGFTIGSLDISSNIALEEIRLNGFDHADLTELDVSNNLNLRVLDCSYNAIPELDLSNHLDLIYLNCTENGLTEIDLSNCPNLKYLDIGYNIGVTEVDLVSSTDLISYNCYYTGLSEIDLSDKSDLEIFDCQSCENLTSLDLRNGWNTALTHTDFIDNPNLFCISVDDAVYSDDNWLIDDHAVFSEDCESLAITQTEPLNINIYPNPSSGNFYIQSENTGAFTINNLQGERILSGDLKPGTNLLNTSLLNSGVYFISIKVGKKDYVEKIMISN